MPENYELEQTLHGYDRGHRLLAASTRFSSEDDRAMLNMSDLSGSRVVDGFFEYITGYMLPSNEFYALAKTWYATEMKRPGCVWTHTLLLPGALLNELRDAEALTSLFVRPQLDLKFKYSDKLPVPVQAWQAGTLGSAALDKEEICALEELYRYNKGVVGISAPSGVYCESFLLKVWSQMWPGLREKVGFCSGALSLRVLGGKPLDLQCGPERIARELKTERDRACTGSPWVQIVLSDLRHPGSFREFLRENAPGLVHRTSMSMLAEVFALISNEDYSAAIERVSTISSDGQDALDLKRTVLVSAVNAGSKFDVSPTLVALSASAFDGVAFEVKGLLRKLVRQDVKIFVEACDAVRKAANSSFVSTLIDILASELTQTDFEWMSEAAPDLFNEVLLQHPAIAYQKTFWNWNLSLFEKVDLFRSFVKRPGFEKSLLFAGVFASGDAELLSRLVGELSDNELPLVLEWIQSNQPAATSLEWTAFLRKHQRGFVAWLNEQEQPTLQTVILAANVLDVAPPLHTVLSANSVVRLAKVVRELPRDRQEVAAFIFVTAAWVRQDEIAPIFFESFAALHKAIAQSRLSNRAWELISPILMPLPNEQWDSCEKLRRAALHFWSINGWNFRPLWQVIKDDLDLFYDFTRTARSYDEGKHFLSLVYDASERGEISLEKKQSKELRKLFARSWW
jgi:GTPase-associated protein 1, N-terminal domain type 1